MSEEQFQTQILIKLGKIEEKLENIEAKVEAMDKELEAVHETALIAQQSAKSAHHRINTQYIICGGILTVVSFIVNYFK